MYWSANKPGLKLYQTRGEISQINLSTMIIEYIGSSFSYHITFGEILIFSRFGHYSWWRWDVWEDQTGHLGVMRCQIQDPVSLYHLGSRSILTIRDHQRIMTILKCEWTRKQFTMRTLIRLRSEINEMVDFLPRTNYQVVSEQSRPSEADIVGCF